MELKPLRTLPHRRFNLLSQEWVLVSPGRDRRPWSGQVESDVPEYSPQYDPGCYLCPGNPRVVGVSNPVYRGTFVFENDFPSLQPETPAAREDTAGLLIGESERGICRVVCYSPRHDLRLALMEAADISAVVDVWTEQYIELGRHPSINSVMIFENRGAMMGASNSHPHGQIWANSSLPNEVAKEQHSLSAWRESRGTCLLCDYARLELENHERMVCFNDEWLALVPYWAVWPFETMLISRAHAGSLTELDTNSRAGLADILQRVTRRYDRLFSVSFPYSFGIHQAPTDGHPHPEWHLHAHFLPPLLRSASVRKFVVGYELMAMPQRDITPETAAERLRELR